MPRVLQRLQMHTHVLPLANPQQTVVVFFTFSRVAGVLAYICYT